MSERIRDTFSLTDYDPAPVYLEDGEDAADVNIAPEEEAGEVEKEREWFFIHCYSGYEAKVKNALESRIESMGMSDEIFDVLIPTEDEIEVKDGKRRTVEKRVFPGYVMVQMRWFLDEDKLEEDKEEYRLHDDAWWVVRNTPGVVGFVGADHEAGIQATPLRPEEVKRIMDRMESEDMVVKVDYKIGERIRIVGGPFNDFPGTVATIDSGREKVRVLVDFFGRETAVTLSFMEVERM